MSYEKRKESIKKIAAAIIAEQYDDTAKYGIANHFLSDMINEMVLQLSPKIHSFTSRVFGHSLETDIILFEDHHHIDCDILRNDDEKRVMIINDASAYGPDDLHYILVVDDVANGALHIRRLPDITLDTINALQHNDYRVTPNFTSSDFILTYYYISDVARMLMGTVKPPHTKQFLDICAETRSIEKMGDRSVQLWDTVEYATAMIGSVLRIIDSNEK